MINFSIKKKNKIPPKTYGIIKCASPPNSSIASGINPKSAAARRIPVANEIRIGMSIF